MDDIAIDKYDAVLKCENFIKEFSNVPMVARGLTKNILRRKEVEDLEKNHLLVKFTHLCIKIF